MKSRTKTKLSNVQITRLVRENFGGETEVGEITELKGGMFNSAYRIQRINEDDDLILKVSVHPDTYTLSYEKDIMTTEVAVYHLVAENTTIPTPQILAHDFSRTLIPSDYFFMTALKGQPMSSDMKKIGPENLNEIKQQLGEFLAQTHKIKGGYFGYWSKDPARQYTSWRDAVLVMFRMILDDGRSMHINLPYARIEKVLEDRADLFDAIQEPVLVNYDLWPGNIFVLKERDIYHIDGIVDFERAFWGDPYADFAPMFMLDENIWQNTAFWRGYTSIAGEDKSITEEDRVRMTLYKMYIWLIMAVEVYRYGFLMGKLQQIYATSRVVRYLKELEAA